jgi:hypothetical protein
MDMNKVQEEINGILDGAGWCTEDYILNFCDHLTEKEQHEVMLKLAKLGKLYKEEFIKDYMDDSEPKTGKMTVKDVAKFYDDDREQNY